jgi:hypothetical protein
MRTFSIPVCFSLATQAGSSSSPLWEIALIGVAAAAASLLIGFLRHGGGAMKKLARVRSSVPAILNALVHVWSTAPAIPAEAQWWLHPM